MKKGIILITFTLFFSVSGGTAQEDWFHQSPPLITGALSDIHVIDTQSAVTVGNSGKVLKTTDGGVTWALKPSQTSSHLSSVYFVNANTGWAVGSSGKIIKTNDGGDTWETQASGTNTILFSVHFVDPDTGWAVGYKRTVLKTTDGGDNWFLQYSEFPVGYFEDVHFMNPNTGIAVGWGGGGSVYRTTDGGQNWTGYSVGNAWIKKVHFINELEGWAVGITASSISEDVWGNRTIYGQHSAIWKTTDGGLTWDVTNFVNTEWLYGVCFVNNNSGWVVGENGTILNTTNGGALWTLQNNPSGATHSFYSVKFFDNSNGWIVGGGGTILQTNNEGIAWELKSGSGTTKTLESIFFLDNSTGWAAGRSGIILNTTDGGTNWLTQPSGTTKDLKSIQFIDESNGWAVGNSGTILNTSNSGISWTEPPSMTTENLYSVCFIDAFIGWTAGAAGTILHTTNGGTSWNEQTSGTDNWLLSIYFVDASTGWAVGSSGMVLNTVDGGVSWNEQRSGKTEDLYSVHFINSTTGWAVGEYQIVLHTTDGGENWPEQWSVPEFYKELNAVYFVDNLTGWAAGSDGSILKTTDGGNSWGQQASGKSYDLNAVHFVNATTGWVAGNGGLILKTTTGGGAILPVPTLGSPSSGSTKISTIPTLSWNPTGGALSYRLQVSKSSNFNSADIVVDQSGIIDTSYSVIGLDFETKYYWRVNAEYTEGTSNWSSVWNFTTIGAFVPTLALPPDGATGISTNPNLSWNPVEGAISYQLQVSRYSSFFSSTIDESGITDTSFLVSGLDDDRKYYWRVNAEHAGGTSNWSSIWSFTTAPDAPNTPSLYSPRDGELQPISPVLYWFSSSRADTYRLQLSTDTTFNVLVYEDSTITDTEKQVGPLDYMTTYFWRVNAKNAGGTSAYSETRSFKTEAEEWHAQESQTTGWLQSVYFFDAYTGWVVGLRGAILKTSDGGTTWNVLTSGTTANLKDIFFVDTLSGYTVGDDGLILKTSDGGTTWNGLTSGTTEDLKAVHFVDTQTGWAAGYNKTILKTTDGGTSWITQSSGTYPFLYDIYFNNSLIGWAVGGEILKTTDGGATWSSIWNDAVSTAVHFIDDQLGWIVGWDGAIYKTSDGGISWNVQISGVTEGLEDVFFVDSLNGCAVGRDGIILKTADGGNSWNLLESGTNEDFYSLYFVDEFTGWVVGSRGIILKTTTGGGITAVEENKNREIPEHFILYQNYPNPFNPTTTIQFALPRAMHVFMKVYNALGLEVATPVDEHLPPGQYKTTWNAADFASGVYVYRIQAGDFVETKKLILLK